MFQRRMSYSFRDTLWNSQNIISTSQDNFLGQANLIFSRFRFVCREPNPSLRWGKQAVALFTVRFLQMDPVSILFYGPPRLEDANSCHLVEYRKSISRLRNRKQVFHRDGSMAVVCSTSAHRAESDVITRLMA